MFARIVACTVSGEKVAFASGALPALPPFAIVSSSKLRPAGAGGGAADGAGAVAVVSVGAGAPEDAAGAVALSVAGGAAESVADAVGFDAVSASFLPPPHAHASAV